MLGRVQDLRSRLFRIHTMMKYRERWHRHSKLLASLAHERESAQTAVVCIFLSSSRTLSVHRRPSPAQYTFALDAAPPLPAVLSPRASRTPHCTNSATTPRATRSGSSAASHGPSPAASTCATPHRGAWRAQAGSKCTVWQMAPSRYILAVRPVRPGSRTAGGAAGYVTGSVTRRSNW